MPLPTPNPADGGAPGTEGQTSPNGITLPDGTVITQEEAVKGYMRQADYTQKTQDVANQRKLAQRGLDLLTALDRDPAATMQLIAQTYNVPTTPPQATVAATAPATNEWGEQVAGETPTVDPTVAALQAEVQRLTSALGGVAQTQQMTALQQEIAAAEAKYDNFDKDVVLRHMQANNLPTVESAYRDLNFADIAAQAAKQAELEAEQARILADKQNLQGVVATSAGIPGGVTETPQTEYTVEAQGSFRDALAAAFQDTLQEADANFRDPALNG